MAIINPGFRIAAQGDGWTNTYEKARANAEQWLAKMQATGMTDVELLDDTEQRDQRWQFTFRHQVTGVTATLEIDGIDNLDAYCERAIFSPKVYWNGSSVGSPRLEDFAAEGFEPVRSFRVTGAQQ